MNYFDEISKVIDYIEDNLRNDITIDDLCNYIYISKYHFQRLFKSIVGESVISYIKKRRVYEAALELKTSNKNILEIAIEFNFNSNEVFSRSFKKIYGITPKKYRDSKMIINKYPKIDLVARKLFINSLGYLISWELVEMPELKLIGLQGVSTGKNDIEITRKIWNELLKELPKLKNIENSNLHYNFLINGFSDDLNIFFGGFKVKNFDFIPSKFILRKINSQKYVKFMHKSESKNGITKSLDKTIDLIYDTWLPNTNYKIDDIGFDLLVVSNEENLNTEGENTIIELYLPLKR
ncbi:AraC family transcriptional regulator [Haliovirga abyssi]|uniref:AraC family transcriptional regulator n=1 Tax=Haliovirga abyssi TaxID=2996794 RepID=A0AAU9DF01_9FUSO|nr:AraC family transcriptional regulator [Haliovirga abyssi]BDU49942.1 AraC family transcriptional regulator [Haliovirga abyssi]